MNYDVFYTKLIEREDNARLHLKNKAKKEEAREPPPIFCGVLFF